MRWVFMTLELPEPDTTRLPRSPLELVVFQVRFNRYAAVSDAHTATRFHAALAERVEGFDDIGEVVSGEVNLSVGPAGQAVNEALTTTTGWRFSSTPTTAAILMPDHVALETSAYTTWEDFAPAAQAVLDAALEVVDPALEQRTGLRYVDRITELGLQTVGDWAPYIQPEMLGIILHADLGPYVRAAHQQVIIELDDGARCGLRHGPLENPATGTVDYVLDLDLFRDGGRPFDAEQIKRELERFHTWALQLFQAAVTDELLSYLRE
jgi:uncharacterized protein (TIGR04255 family)